MSVSNIPIFQKLVSRINVLSLRQKLLAENLAHINTPHKKEKDIDPRVLVGQNSGFAKQILLRQTNSKHVAPKENTTSETPKIITSKNKEDMTIQGNNISLDQQLQKVEETRLAHLVATTIYRKNHDLLRSVLTLSKG